MSEARQAMEAEVAPIDDIRSSALYRLHVAGNLLQEFLEGLFRLNQILARWNALPPEEAATEILSCCGSRAWARISPPGGRSRTTRLSLPR